MEIKTEIRGLADQKKKNPDVSDSPVVGEEEIAQIVASWTGVPVQKLTES